VTGKILDFADIAFSLGTLILSEVDLLRSQLFNQWIEGKEVDVFQMVVGSVHFLELFGRLSWVHTLEDAQFSEILQGKLELPDRF
jgi:hypothetical protein